MSRKWKSPYCSLGWTEQSYPGNKCRSRQLIGDVILNAILMGLGSAIGVILISTVLGGLAAAGVAALLIQLLQISNFEGGSGYFAAFVTVTGIVAGFILGLIATLAVRSDFWRVQAAAAGAILVLAVLGVVLPVVLNDEGPKLNGENLTLQIELKSPPGWKPDRSRAGQTHGNFCWLQQYAADAPTEQNRINRGGIRLAQRDSAWIAGSSFDLRDTRSDRYVRIFLGKTVDISIDVPLPRHPGREFKEWSSWTASGLYPQKDAPVPPGFSWRFRVQTVSADRQEFPESQAKLDAYRREHLHGLRPEDPLAKWLPIFEGPDGEPQQLPNPNAIQSMLQDRPTELAQLLLSTDRNVRRTAVFAAATYYPRVPQSVIQPLAAAGGHTVELIQEAAAANPDTPDLAAENRAYTYYHYWAMAVSNGGEEAGRLSKPVFEKIERAALMGPREGRIHDIAESAHENLNKINASK